jgi:hypothetical protein
MNIREATISKIQQLPESLLQEVDDFIDFVVLKHNAGSQVSSNSKQKNLTRLRGIAKDASVTAEDYSTYLMDKYK